MPRFALALAAALAVATPVAANPLSLLLQTLTFPSDIVTPSTKGCENPATQSVCQLSE